MTDAADVSFPSSHQPVPNTVRQVTADHQTPTGRKSWHRRKFARPAEILEAALAEFSANGFTGSHMEDIARRADVTKGTIYLYYKNKEDLFGALIHDQIGKDLAALAPRAAAGVPPKKAFSDYLVEVGLFFAEHNRAILLKLLFSESNHVSALAGLYRTEIIDKITACLTGIGGGDSGLYRLPAEQIAQLCIAPALLLSLDRAESVDQDTNAAVAAQLDVVLRGSLVNHGVAEAGAS